MKQRSADAARRKAAGNRTNTGPVMVAGAPGIVATIRRALLTPRIVMVDCSVVIRLLEGETVHVGACNVSLVPTADVPKLRDIVRVQNRIRKEKRDSEKAAAKP